MTITKHAFRFQGVADGLTTGIAHGYVSVVNVPFVGLMLAARIGYELRRNPALLATPDYDQTFALADEAKAVRALKAAARRRNLKLISA